MRKNMLLFLCCMAPAWILAQKKFTITVKLKSPPKIYTKAYLHYDYEGTEMLDSAVANKGIFIFQGEVKDPASGQLLLDHAGIGLGATVAIAKSDVIDIYVESGNTTITGKDSLKTAKMVTPTGVNEKRKAYEALSKTYNEELTLLNEEYLAVPEENRKDSVFLAGLNAKVAVAIKKRNVILEDYVRKDPAAPFALDALKAMGTSDEDLVKIKPLFSLLPESVRTGYYGVDFAKKIAAAENLSIGKKAYDFTSKDTADVAVKLSDFKGKYVLLDFWASWCGPCRKENPNLVKTFAAFRDKNFTIVSVSLDRESKRKEWLAAIKADGIGGWTHLLDLNGFEGVVAQLYGIDAIPSNFLLDPDGTILAKDLVGEALDKRLESLLGHPNAFQVEGSLQNAPDGTMVYLSYYIDNTRFEDSAVVAGGVFTFKGIVKDPLSAYMRMVQPGQLASLGTKDSRSFYLEPGVIRINGKDAGSAVINGGPRQQDLNRMLSMTAVIDAKLDSVMTQITRANDKMKKKTLFPLLNTLGMEKEVLIKEFVKENPGSYVSLDQLIARSNPIGDLEEMEEQFQSLSGQVRQSDPGKKLAALLEEASPTKVGKPAIEIAQTDMHGRPFTLSSLRGNYVLVDFWASWCGGCRVQTPAFRKIYAEFKKKKFEIVGVSLDHIKKNWLDAIAADKADWVQVSDLKGQDNSARKAYGIRGVPQNLLISPDGMIIGRNLSPEKLELELKRILL